MSGMSIWFGSSAREDEMRDWDVLHGESSFREPELGGWCRGHGPWFAKPDVVRCPGCVRDEMIAAREARLAAEAAAVEAAAAAAAVPVFDAAA